MAYTITLPWPAEELWANRRPHWSARHRETVKHRRWAKDAAKAARVPQAPRARLAFAFHPPPRSRPDLQNMPATMKAYIDGIADAMGCDDRHFIPVWPEAFATRVKLGQIIITVSED